MDTRHRRLAIYPGTFDPLTNGHAGLVRRGLRMFDTIIFAIAGDSTKKPLFSLEERVTMAKAVFAEEPKVQVESFTGLVMKYAEERGACALLRGMRATSDFEFEFQSALMNRHLNQHIETLFLMADYRWLYTSSSIVKTVASLGGDVSRLVPPQVFEQLCQRYGKPHYGHDEIMDNLPSGLPSDAVRPLTT